MRRALGVTAFVLLLVVVSVQAAHAGAGDYDLFLEKVKLRPGVKCDIHLKVFVNDEQPRFGKTVFAISGWVHSAQSWDEYAEALFAHPFKGARTSRLVAIDQPGRGLSSLPTKISFGELLLDDYVTAILAALDRLPAHGICPQEIIGFSQGGMLVQMVQEHLLDSGSSLFEEYGIFRAVLLGTGASGVHHPDAMELHGALRDRGTRIRAAWAPLGHSRRSSPGVVLLQLGWCLGWRPVARCAYP